MNFFQFHIGDYAAATAHLSLIEDAIYSRLLRRYYLQESPLPVDLGQVARLAGARSADEIAAVEVVLSEFFTLTDAGWCNKRADEEIARYQGKQAKAKASADARWNADAMRTHSGRKAGAMRTHSGGNANQEPITKNQEEAKADELRSSVVSDAKAAPPACPHDEIVAAYHEILPELPRVRVWDSGRQQFLRSRWRESPERQTLDWWREFFGYVRRCPFLLGQQAVGDRDPFLADLEWLIRPQNFRKVIEGKYERRAA